MVTSPLLCYKLRIYIVLDGWEYIIEPEEGEGEGVVCKMAALTEKGKTAGDWPVVYGCFCYFPRTHLLRYGLHSGMNLRQNQNQPFSLGRSR